MTCPFLLCWSLFLHPLRLGVPAGYALILIPTCVSSQKPAEPNGYQRTPATDQDLACGSAIQAGRATDDGWSESQQPWPWPSPCAHPYSTLPSSRTLWYLCFLRAWAEVSAGLSTLTGPGWWLPTSGSTCAGLPAGFCGQVRGRDRSEQVGS